MNENNQTQVVQSPEQNSVITNKTKKLTKMTSLFYLSLIVITVINVVLNIGDIFEKHFIAWLGITIFSCCFIILYVVIMIIHYNNLKKDLSKLNKQS